MKKWDHLHNTTKACIIILGSFAVLVVYFGWPFWIDGLPDAEEKAKRGKANTEYRSIFNPAEGAKLKMYHSQVVIAQHPILSFNYDGEYNVIVQKYTFIKPLQFSESYIIDMGEVPKGGSFQGVGNFNYSVTCDSLITMAQISFDGYLENKEVVGDSILLLQVNTAHVVFSGEENGSSYLEYNTIEHSVEPEKDKKTPIVIALVKRKQDVFLVMITEGKAQPTIRTLKTLLGVTDDL